MSLSRPWRCFILFALVAGILLRVICVGDMEYKSDEAYMFERLMRVGVTESWPKLGMPSGVLMKNPPLSVWLFLALGKLFQVRTATGLCRVVMGLNSFGLIGAFIFALKGVKLAERQAWIWGAALTSVNPISIWFERKIWGQSMLPLFAIAFYWAWWNRRRRSGAFFWGLIGALLGQIHMSGFFFAFAFVLGGLIFDRKKIHWGPWFAGSILGSLSLLPWLHYLATEPLPSNQDMHGGVSQFLQFRYFVFWVANASGLDLGNTLGVHLPGGILGRMRFFFDYPLIGGQKTKLVLMAHVMVVIALLNTLVPSIVAMFRRPLGWGRWVDPCEETHFSITLASLLYGTLISATGILVRRYYVLVTTPLSSVWLATQALSRTRGNRWLGIFFGAFLIISISFLQYIHVNGGAESGDYGRAYRLQTLAPSLTP